MVVKITNQEFKSGVKTGIFYALNNKSGSYKIPGWEAKTKVIKLNFINNKLNNYFDYKNKL